MVTCWPSYPNTLGPGRSVAADRFVGSATSSRRPTLRDCSRSDRLPPLRPLRPARRDVCDSTPRTASLALLYPRKNSRMKEQGTDTTPPSCWSNCRTCTSVAQPLRTAGSREPGASAQVLPAHVDAAPTDTAIPPDGATDAHAATVRKRPHDHAAPMKSNERTSRRHSGQVERGSQR